MHSNFHFFIGSRRSSSTICVGQWCCMHNYAHEIACNGNWRDTQHRPTVYRENSMVCFFFAFRFWNLLTAQPTLPWLWSVWQIQMRQTDHIVFGTFENEFFNKIESQRNCWPKAHWTRKAHRQRTQLPEAIHSTLPTHRLVFDGWTMSDSIVLQNKLDNHDTTRQTKGMSNK